MTTLRLTVAADCLLENVPLELEKTLKLQLTIDNPKYIAARRYGRWVGKKLKPQLKYYEQLPNGLRFPRGFSNQAVLLCRQQLGESPEIIDKRRELAEVDYRFFGRLRPYQQKAVEAVAARSFGVLEAGTGSGKTIMAIALIARRRQPTLIIVHTKELLYQWRDRLHQFLRRDPGLIGDGNSFLADVTVAIVNSARKKVEELAPRFGQLVVDECHRVPAALFTDVVSGFDCQYLLGLSATAFRRDEGMTRLIHFYMGDPVYKVDQGELTASGAIVRPQLVLHKTDFEYGYRGDYQALLSALTTHQGRNRQIIEDIAAAAEEDGVTLVVSDRLSHCRVFEESLVKKGFRVALLTGQTAAEKRALIVDEVQKGDVQILIATLQLIGEGFDCPGLSTLFLTTPISFEGRLMQVIGRIMRPAANKRPRVYDYLDHRVSALRKSANLRYKTLRKILEPAVIRE